MLCHLDHLALPQSIAPYLLLETRQGRQVPEQVGKVVGGSGTEVDPKTIASEEPQWWRRQIATFLLGSCSCN